MDLALEKVFIFVKYKEAQYAIEEIFDGKFGKARKFTY